MYLFFIFVGVPYTWYTRFTIESYNYYIHTNIDSITDTLLV